ncbi:hypothetical protein [Mycolicibacterium sediminis]|uniref:Uncharacterized protein n=1 Tax=Mycolicibacterium sediminis TaxID=1286180 RepID=A0A7I7QLG7_9MYCO|nr:hypothetical protein [Mycolicibacterium sediminis]BBY26837.1 hypothetical protein MSEDJ_09330 [Mycolicibacterium sediminis]
MADHDELNERFHLALEAADITADQLWLRYFSLGGDADRFALDAYLNGAIALPPDQHDMLAHAINERLDEIAPPRAPYSDEFSYADGGSESGPTDADGRS